MREAIKLCLVTQLKAGELKQYKRLLHLALKGGVTSVQLRAKTGNAMDFYHMAVSLKTFLKPFNVPLIINDHLEIAVAMDADSVHVGQSDVSPEIARQLLGENKIIGLSIESIYQLGQANNLDCIDYVAASAVFPSRSKPDCKTIWDLHGLTKVTSLSRHPVVAIGV